MSKYKVDGMTCNGCAKSVTRAIKAAAGDASAEVAVDLTAKTITVTGFNDAKAIGQAVEDAGFDFGGVA